MRDPIEIPLKYRDEGNGLVSLAVDPVDNCNYVWQKCKRKTANWETICTTTSNIKTESISPIINEGDKYRCIILTNGKITHYTNTFLVSDSKFNSSYSKTHNYYDYGGNNNRKKEPSVSDTDGMDGLVFERYCAEILSRNGFSDVKVTQGSGDYGIDILAKKDAISYAIQCKCYSDKVSNKAIQEAFSGKSFYGCMVAAVLTNSYFTDSAIETAKRNSVLLWDRDFLDQMIREAGSSQQRSNNYEYKKWHEESSSKSNKQTDNDGSTAFNFFRGCNDYEQVKERYKSLMKTYHPDNTAGDEEYTKIIISQYKVLKDKFSK